MTLDVVSLPQKEYRYKDNVIINYVREIFGENMRVVKQVKDYIFNTDERYFIFTDGSLRKNIKNRAVVGLGADVRNSEGRKVLFYSEDIPEHNIPSFANKNQFEELAVLNTLEICYKQGIKNLFVQSDSQSMISKINKNLQNKIFKEDLNKEHDIFVKIHNMIEKFNEIFFEYIPREENSSADFYSRAAKTLNKKNNTPVVKSSYELLREVHRDMFMKNRTLCLNIHPNSQTPSLSKKESDNYIDRIINIKLEDNKQEKKFEIAFKVELNGAFENNYKKVVAKYNDNNKLIVLAYLLTNLITEKSSVPLMISSYNSKIYWNFNYTDNVWIQFNNFEHNQKKLSKKVLNISVDTLNTINKIVKHDFTKKMTGQVLQNMEKFLFNQKKFHSAYVLF